LDGLTPIRPNFVCRSAALYIRLINNNLL